MLQTGRTKRKKSKPIERERNRDRAGRVGFEILNFPSRLLYGFGNFKIRSGQD